MLADKLASFLPPKRVLIIFILVVFLIRIGATLCCRTEQTDGACLPLVSQVVPSPRHPSIAKTVIEKLSYGEMYRKLLNLMKTVEKTVVNVLL